MTDRTISHNGLALIENFEGCELKAYRDAKGVLTIGYGHTSAAGAPRVYDGMEITKGEADTILSNDLEMFEGIVNRHVRVELTQNQFDALTSFVFNLGETNLVKSSLLRDVNAGNMAGAKAQFARWTRSGGRVLADLVRRRAAEATLFATPDVHGPTPAHRTPPPVAEDPLSTIADSLDDVIDGAIKTLAPSASSAPVSDPSPPTTGTSDMNPLVAISIIEQVMTYAPEIETVLSHVPDIAAKGKDAIAKFSQMDFKDGITDIEEIVGDLGISQQMLSTIIGHATKSAPPTAPAAALA